MQRVDFNGNPITSEEFFKLQEDFQYVKVDVTYLEDSKENKIRVSTVWLGDAFAPFETMVFGGSMDGYSERYATSETAKKGHECVVKKVKETL